MSDKSKSKQDHRQLHVKVKTAKGRKISSTRWLERQLNDPYVQRAKQDGYRSRSAYKLIDMDDKFHILQKGKNIIDLGAAPGGWCQVTVQRAAGSRIVGIDLQEMEPIAGATLIKHDFMADDAHEILRKELQGELADIILSDMAAPSCGHTPTDHLRIVNLCEVAFHFAKHNLNQGGVFIAKILQGGTEKDLLAEMKKYFKTVKHFKPDASRADSAEMYVVALHFRRDT